MSYQHKFVIKNLRDGMGHVRKQTLNFKAGKCWELLGAPIARNSCTLAGGSRLLLLCSSAGIIVTIRCLWLETTQEWFKPFFRHHIWIWLDLEVCGVA
jgi:hypothetical protein